ncbi:MAG: hypothetical protein FWJ70_02860 [Micromonosporaceae bacterium]|mgnify:CR=1 FL=1|jgi:hypothetical protein
MAGRFLRTGAVAAAAVLVLAGCVEDSDGDGGAPTPVGSGARG